MHRRSEICAREKLDLHRSVLSGETASSWVPKAKARLQAIACTRIETARMNRINPDAWLTRLPKRIADHKINRIGELACWNRTPKQASSAARPDGYKAAGHETD
jgi:hypothetical protein